MTGKTVKRGYEQTAEFKFQNEVREIIRNGPFPIRQQDVVLAFFNHWFKHKKHSPTVHPGRSKLMEAANVSRSTVNTTLKTLREAGIIVPTAYERGGQGKATEYRVNLEALTAFCGDQGVIDLEDQPSKQLASNGPPNFSQKGVNAARQKGVKMHPLKGVNLNPEERVNIGNSFSDYLLQGECSAIEQPTQITATLRIGPTGGWVTEALGEVTSPSILARQSTQQEAAANIQTQQPSDHQATSAAGLEAGTIATPAAAQSAAGRPAVQEPCSDPQKESVATEWPLHATSGPMGPTSYLKPIGTGLVTNTWVEAAEGTRIVRDVIEEYYSLPDDHPDLWA